MQPHIQEWCDVFIRRCQDAIAMMDIEESRRIIMEASTIFGSIIPNWQGGLMSQFTGFYFDDIHMIHGKLNTFKANSYNASPRDFMKSHHAEAVIESDELFETAIVQVHDLMNHRNRNSDSIVKNLRAMQRICTSESTVSDRWQMIRPLLSWAATLDDGLAQHVLPLFVRTMR